MKTWHVVTIFLSVEMVSLFGFAGLYHLEYQRDVHNYVVSTQLTAMELLKQNFHPLMLALEEGRSFSQRTYVWEKGSNPALGEEETPCVYECSQPAGDGPWLHEGPIYSFDDQQMTIRLQWSVLGCESVNPCACDSPPCYVGEDSDFQCMIYAYASGGVSWQCDSNDIELVKEKMQKCAAVVESYGSLLTPLGYWDFWYFSLMTMSTVGYGDFVPASTGPRVAAAVQVLLQLLILTIIIPILLGSVGSQEDRYVSFSLRNIRTRHRNEQDASDDAAPRP